MTPNAFCTTEAAAIISPLRPTCVARGASFASAGRESWMIMRHPMPHLCSAGLLLLALAPFVNAQTTPQAGRVRACGNVMSVTCSPERVSFTLEIAGPDVITIETGGIADQVSLREFAARLVLHEAC